MWPSLCFVSGTSIIDQIIKVSDGRRSRLLSSNARSGMKRPSFKGNAINVQGIVRRSRSIQIDPEEIPGELISNVRFLFCDVKQM